jgi:hypothetical protein
MHAFITSKCDESQGTEQDDKRAENRWSTRHGAIFSFRLQLARTKPNEHYASAVFPKNETEWVYFYRTIRVSRGARSPNVAVVVRENLEAPPDTGGFTLPPNRAACQHHQHVTDESHTITAMTSPTPLSGVGYKTRHVVGCGTCEKRHTRSHTNTHAHTCAEKCLCFGPLTGSQPYWSSSMQSMHMRGSGPTRLAEPARASVPPLIAAVLGAPASGAVTGDVGTKPSKLASEAEMEGVCAEEARLA